MNSNSWSPSQARQATLVHIDDDGVDRASLRRAARKAGIEIPVIEACDGLEGLALLRGDNGHQPAVRPVVVLLDLNMPCLDGFGFLARLRADPQLKDTAVFVFSTSDAPRDQARAREQGVAGYIVKGNYETFDRVVRMIELYTRVVALPA